jgi:hypothetical protein
MKGSSRGNKMLVVQDPKKQSMMSFDEMRDRRTAITRGRTDISAKVDRLLHRSNREIAEIHSGHRRACDRLKLEFDEKMEYQDLKDKLRASQCERSATLQASMAKCTMEQQIMRVEGVKQLSDFAAVAPPWKKHCENALSVVDKSCYSEHTAWRSRVKVNMADSVPITIRRIAYSGPVLFAGSYVRYGSRLLVATCMCT